MKDGSLPKLFGETMLAVNKQFGVLRPIHSGSETRTEGTKGQVLCLLNTRGTFGVGLPYFPQVLATSQSGFGIPEQFVNCSVGPRTLENKQSDGPLNTSNRFRISVWLAKLVPLGKTPPRGEVL